MQKYEKQQPLHTFRPMSIVAKRSPISATAELLLLISKCRNAWQTFRCLDCMTLKNVR